VIRQALEGQHAASVKIIAVRADSPSIFLLDEVHNLTELIDDNIRIAKTLVQIGKVSLLGVEGCAGDKISIQDLMHLSSDGRCFAERPRMISAMLNEKYVEIVGVDSRELCSEINKDCEQGIWTEATHPKQEIRSAYMARTFVQKIRARRNIQAALLNAGKRHNDDIEAIVRAEKPNDVGANGISFIRVRSRLFPQL